MEARCSVGEWEAKTGGRPGDLAAGAPQDAIAPHKGKAGPESERQVAGLWLQQIFELEWFLRVKSGGERRLEVSENITEKCPNDHRHSRFHIM